MIDIKCIPILLVGLITCITDAFGQSVHTSALIPPDDYENIHVTKLNEDSLNSTFCIWVKNAVRPHKHIYHTEVVLVLEGSGKMTLGNDTFEISAGDYVFIPRGTVHSVDVTSAEPIKVLSIQSPRFDGSDRVFVTPDH